VSTIKSSAEDLTLNADGSGNDIKFQSDGVEKASISSAGLLTSTTIDATALTGNLPAIDGSNLTGIDAGPDLDGAVTINESGADVDFRVEGSGEANALFVQGSDGNVGIRTNAPDARLQVVSTSGTTTNIAEFEAAIGGYTGTSLVASNTLGAASTYSLFKCVTDSDGDGGGPVTQFEVKGDGRGLSQFTAKAWAQWSGTALTDSHNISSASDGGTGQYTFNFSNNMANTTYSVVASSHKAGGGPSASNSAALSVGEARAVGSCLIESFRADLATREDKPVHMVVFGD
jgi:hypothetical protein